MKNGIKIVLFALLATVFARAENYEIKVCKVKLTNFLGFDQNLINLFHVYVQGEENNTITSLNFGPVNKTDLFDIIFGVSRRAQVSHEQYDGAECESVLSTNNEDIFRNNWNKIKETYANIAKNCNYQLYNVDGKNCGKVAEEAIKSANLTFPFSGINAQNDTERFLYGVGDLGRMKNPDDAVKTVLEIAESGNKIVNSIVGKKEECCIQ